jgi:hypothetical protein
VFKKRRAEKTVLGETRTALRSIGAKVFEAIVNDVETQLNI